MGIASDFEIIFNNIKLFYEHKLSFINQSGKELVVRNDLCTITCHCEP